MQLWDILVRAHLIPQFSGSEYSPPVFGVELQQKNRHRVKAKRHD